VTRSFLDKAYDLQTAEETIAFYEEWAQTYDREVDAQGYATPERCAKILAGALHDRQAAILDLGCGTGRSGLALQAAGFTLVDGTDISPAMMAQARTKGIYRALIAATADDPLPADAGRYRAILACGVMSPGHAPASLIDTVLARQKRGALFAFSLNDHALEDASYMGRIRDHLDSGNAQMLARDHGAHLPGIDLKSTVYLLQKT